MSASSVAAAIANADGHDYDAAQQGEELEEEEQSISAFFVIISLLLALVTILAKALRDRPRVARFLPEAGMIILTGLSFGGILHLFLDDEAGSAAAGGRNSTALEEEEEEVAESLLLSFSPEVFFPVLLPPIIFLSGYTLKRRLFFRNIVPICLFAVVGTLVSALVIAGVLQLVATAGWIGGGGDGANPWDEGAFRPRFSELLTFGALLSATDPVTTLSVFQEKRVDPHLFYLVFGESVLNDAVGLVLFNAFSYFVTHTNDTEEDAFILFEFLLGFFLDSLGSPVLGLLSGLVAAWIFKHLDMRSTPLLELCLFILIMYVPFLLAELLQLSGIVTILFSGLAAQIYVVPNLSPKTVENAGVIFHAAAHLAETAIFLELGLSVFGLTGSIQAAFIGWTVVACLVGRAANVYPITFFFNRSIRRGEGADLVSRDDLDLQESVDAIEDGGDRRATTVVELSDLSRREGSGAGEQRQDAEKDAKPQRNDLPPSEIANGSDEGRDTSVSPQDRRDLMIAPNTAHMIWFSGLRGAVAYACVRSFPDSFGHANEFTMTTMIIVLLSVFGLGGTTECMLNVLDIEMNVDEGVWTEWCREGPRSGWFDRVYRLVVRDPDDDATRDPIPPESPRGETFRDEDDSDASDEMVLT